MRMQRSLTSGMLSPECFVCAGVRGLGRVVFLGVEFVLVVCVVFRLRPYLSSGECPEGL